MRSRRPHAVMQIIAMMRVRMIVMSVIMVIAMVAVVVMMTMVAVGAVVVAMARFFRRLDHGTIAGAPANRTHQITSRSLIRNSSPPVTRVRDPPHFIQSAAWFPASKVSLQSKHHA